MLSSGPVLIGGIFAPVASWERTRIVAHIPEVAHLAPWVSVPNWYADLDLNVYLDGLKAHLKVLQHFMSTICSLINSPSKLRRIDECVAKGTFASVSFKPFDSLVDLLATFKARNLQR